MNQYVFNRHDLGTGHECAKRVRGRRPMKTGPPGEKLLGIAQAARILDMNHITVGKLVRQGTLRGSKTENGHWVVPETEVMRYATALRAARSRPKIPAPPAPRHKVLRLPPHVLRAPSVDSRPALWSVNKQRASVDCSAARVARAITSIELSRSAAVVWLVRTPTSRRWKGGGM